MAYMYESDKNNKGNLSLLLLGSEIVVTKTFEALVCPSLGTRALYCGLP
jgi:hypothetical protein